MKKSVHVCSSGMMNKALSAHGCAISAVTSTTLLFMEGLRLLAAPRDSKGRQEAVSLWGRRHRDKVIAKHLETRLQ